MTERRMMTQYETVQLADILRRWAEDNPDTRNTGWNDLTARINAYVQWTPPLTEPNIRNLAVALGLKEIFESTKPTSTDARLAKLESRVAQLETAVLDLRQQWEGVE